ncbi:hypothetical protein BU23DRAFT_563718 [Bimuria novae-zelandiae CBS 107.79]|uniref:Uncharacterized protein n=1 Tax=Bimuria novae-zelandiae CBS 107.79 TaxID=1447943 RepID=A0A6A5VQF3_9PLEO|nr:hypothetical protein BU23DRAFT_563718 [Bimuria novae-zelandiae CBS 107.79]
MNDANAERVGEPGSHHLEAGCHTADLHYSTCSAASRPTADPSVPSSEGVCHLFRLPRELRDIVYEYALTEPEGLFFRGAPEQQNKAGDIFPAFASSDAAANETSVEANQFRLVCRQVHRETSGLGVKFNGLHFFSTDLARPAN